MIDQLLTTKLYIPPVRPSRVSRPRLLQRLDEGLSQGVRLILVSGPAGFGKTTLLAEWVNQKAEGRRMKDEEFLLIHPSYFCLPPFD